MGAVANAATMARDTTFRDRCLAALIYRAREVIATEPATSGRFQFARAIVQSPLSYVDTVAWVIAADPQVASKTLTQMLLADAEQLILDRVLVAWDYLAVVSAPYPRV